MMMKYSLAGVVLILVSVMAQAQEKAKQDAEMADLMRSNGKIYVVIAVMLTILTGLILYMMRLDRKISKMEKGK